MIQRHEKEESDAPLDKNETSEEIALTVNETIITKSQFDYYYNMAYQYYAQMESSYNQQGVSMGFPLDKAPDEVSTGQTDKDGKQFIIQKQLQNMQQALRSSRQLFIMKRF